jgi:uracil-DNA glycosylase
MKAIVWVGLNPSPKNTTPETAFVGSPSGKNLAKWQVEVDKKVKSPLHHKMYNLCTVVSSSERAISQEMADVGAIARILKHYRNNDTIVALGNKASKILLANNIPHIKMPHPSPANRQLNNHVFIKNKLKYLKNNIMGSKLK